MARVEDEEDYLKEAFNPRRRVFRACTIEAVREEHNETTLFQPLRYENRNTDGSMKVATSEACSAQDSLSAEDMNVSMMICAPLKKSPNYQVL